MGTFVIACVCTHTLFSVCIFWTNIGNLWREFRGRQSRQAVQKSRHLAGIVTHQPLGPAAQQVGRVATGRYHDQGGRSSSRNRPDPRPHLGFFTGGHLLQAAAKRGPGWVVCICLEAIRRRAASGPFSAASGTQLKRFTCQ